MGDLPSKWKDDDRPVEQVSFSMAEEFCDALSELPAEKAAGRVYRLPTEAEWEYACRAGSGAKHPFGDEVSQLGDYAWFADNSGVKPFDANAVLKTLSNNYAEYQLLLEGNGCQTHIVAQKKPNAWGLYDMLGNVSEWCSDRFGEPGGEDAVDPIGPSEGDLRVDKGSSWWNDAAVVTPAWRYGRKPDAQFASVGFRVVMTQP